MADITNSLRSLMVRNMGVIRDKAGLIQAQRDVAFWCRYVLAREFDSRPGWELQNLLTHRPADDPLRLDCAKNRAAFTFAATSRARR